MASWRGSRSSCPSPAPVTSRSSEKMLGLAIDDPAVDRLHGGHPDRARSRPCCCTSGATSGRSRGPGASGWSGPRCGASSTTGWAGTSSSGRSRSWSRGAAGARDLITGAFRNLWWVAGSLIVWSAVMVRRSGSERRNAASATITMRDSIVMGVVQCCVARPRRVSRSGATISAGPVRRPRPGGVDAVGLLLVDPGADGRGHLRAAAMRSPVTSPSLDHRRRPWSASWWRTRRWRGCCGSWRTTRSSGSLPTGSPSD